MLTLTLRVPYLKMRPEYSDQKNVELLRPPHDCFITAVAGKKKTGSGTAAANEDGEVSLGVGGCVSDLKRKKEISGDAAKHPRTDAADAKADSKADAKAKTAARALAKHLLK